MSDIIDNLSKSKDDRRSQKFSKSKKHFLSGKHQPRTKSDLMKLKNNATTSRSSRSKNENKLIAAETIEILEKGTYTIEPEGIIVDISNELREAALKTITYKPEDTPIVLLQENNEQQLETEFIVVKRTTLNALQEATEESSDKHICVLNFASAKNPGGGFIHGSEAQEESLARSSSLFHCIEDSIMYEHNREDNNNCLYSHHMIFSPNVCIFRDSNADLLHEPYPASIITVPAVNTFEALKRDQSADIIRKTMQDRIDRFLSVAVHHKVDLLILGAWGCGVFGGNIKDLVEDFHDALIHKYLNRFQKVIFALLEEADFELFKKTFS